MKKVLLISLIAFTCTIYKSNAQIHIKDSLALVDLYDSCGGTHWTHHDNWLTKAPVSTWYGIFYIFNNHVTGIDLQGNNLRGTIPASIGNMPLLTTAFIVSDNKIKEPLPASLKNITAYDFQIDNNALDFDGIEELTPVFDNQNHNYTYSPQANITLKYKGNKFSVDAGGTPANDTFHWYKNGVLVKTNIGNSKFISRGAGSYHVVVKNRIATQLTLYSDTVTVSAFTAEQKSFTQNQNSISLYPNPAKDLLNLSLSASQNEKAQLQIIDENGKIILNQNINLAAGVSTQTINISKFARGNYFVEIKMDEGSESLKFVKE